MTKERKEKSKAKKPKKIKTLIDLLKNLLIKANVQLIRTCVLVRYLEHGTRKGLPDRSATYLIDLGKHIKKEGLKQPILFPVSKITERTCIYKKNTE